MQLPRVLTRDRNPGRDVRQLHAVADLVDFLPARPTALLFFVQSMMCLFVLVILAHISVTAYNTLLELGGNSNISRRRKRI